MSKYRRKGRRNTVDFLKPSEAVLREQLLNRLTPIQEERDHVTPRTHLPKIPKSKLVSNLVDKDEELDRLIDRYLNRAHYMANLINGGPYNSHFCECCWERNKENLNRNRSKVQPKPLNGYTVESASLRHQPGSSLTYVTFEDAYNKAMSPRAKAPPPELELPSSTSRIQAQFTGRPEEMVYMFPPSGVDIDVDLQLKLEGMHLDRTKTPDNLNKAMSRYERSMQHLQSTIHHI